jgi:hypothetical protein
MQCEITCVELCEKSKSSRVDTNDRSSAIDESACLRNQRAVAAHDDGDIKAKRGVKRFVVCSHVDDMSVSRNRRANLIGDSRRVGLRSIGDEQRTERHRKECTERRWAARWLRPLRTA